MLGYFADEIARFAGRLGPAKRVKVPDGVVKINLGSGLHTAPGWIHVDGQLHALFSKAPRAVLSRLYRSSGTMQAERSEAEYIDRLQSNRFVFYEMERGLPFDDETADYVYSSHVLEHFFLVDGKRLVGEIQRILKPGGTVRLCVPDLDHAFALYQEGRVAEALQFFFTDSEAAYYHRHRYMYNFANLSQLLHELGFEGVQRCAYQSGAVPDINLLDNRPEETLYVEARKPGPRS